MAEQRVPAELARLWRLPAGSRRGRPAELDVDRVVRAAVELADRDGLAGVALSKVATSLGYTTMSLYRHVGSKEELLTLMGDHVSGAPPDLPEQWRDGLRRWAVAARAAYVEHPWLADVPVTGPPAGPNAIAWFDAGLRALRDTALDWGAKVGIIAVLGGYVRTAAQLAQELESGRRGTGRDQSQVQQDYGRTLAKLVEPDRFPEAAKLFTSGLFEQPPEPPTAPTDPDFQFGLELILDGVAAAVDAAGTSE